MSKPTILVVDDEALIRWSLTERLKSDGYEVVEAETGQAALEPLAEGVDLALLDYRLPDTDGVAVLRKIKELDQDILVILLTAFATVDTAVEAMKLGAYHFANKPFDLDEIAAAVERALETTRLRREVRQLRANAARPYSLERIVGESPADDASSAAARTRRVEPGLYRAAHRRERHRQGPGRQGPALRQRSRRAPVHEHHLLGAPETLLESELFGHERGAFTDARQQKKGLLEMADGGTVFLDEIGEMTPGAAGEAPPLPRREEPSGASAASPTSASTCGSSPRRIGTSRRRSRQGKFREDLFYRLNVLPIALPPLRAHNEDIPLLVELLHRHFQSRVQKNGYRRVAGAMRLLQGYGWPGNVRELRNAVERAMLLSDADRLEPVTSRR